jgi:hypothetical protein
MRALRKVKRSLGTPRRWEHRIWKDYGENVRIEDE